MGEHHPDERELALHLAGGEDRGIEHHLRWCRTCRRVADEYRWLEAEVPAALRAGADAAPVPRPRWGDIEARLETVRRRRVVVRRLPAVASVAVVLVAMLLFSSIVVEAGSQVYAASIEPTLAPQPVAQAQTGSRTPTVAPAFGEGDRPPVPTATLRPAPSVEMLTSSPQG